MEVLSFPTIRPPSSNLNNFLSDRSRSESFENSFQSVNELIANLDHELQAVRVRAVKCILGKIECDLVTTEYLSRRIDLLNRLSDWVKTAVENAEGKAHPKRPEHKSTSRKEADLHGVPHVLQLLLFLSEFERVRKFISEEKLDSVLVKLRRFLDGESSTLLEKLFNGMCTNTFELDYKGSPEAWNDNTNSHLLQYQSSNGSYISEDKSGENTLIMSDHIAPSRDSFFQTQSFNSKRNSPGFRFEIPAVNLGGQDRRVLSSTIESLLSKNETVVYNAVSFFRDVLLQDYPQEVFIQESSLCMALVEVAESAWNDPKILQVSKSGLLLLFSKLRIRFAQLTSSEFFENKRHDDSRSPVPPSGYTLSGFSRHTSPQTPNTDVFLSNICQLLKGVSRTLLFHPQDFHMWVILDSFALTLCKCSQTFPIDMKTLSLSVQEILLDLSYCYDKHSHDINSTLLAITLSSLLKSLTGKENENEEPFILAYDVRQCLRKLSRCPVLCRDWPEVHKYFLKFASPMVDGLNMNVIEEDFSPSKNREEREQQLQIMPKDAVKQIVITVQNAASHQAVSQAIDSLWEYVIILSVNVRSGEVISLDEIVLETPWRDSFYRFLCVEPTCNEDEDLLVKVLHLLTFLIANLGSEGYAAFEQWVIPLCMEKGCAVQKVFWKQCLIEEPQFNGTVLPILLRSLFDFFFVVMKKASKKKEIAEYKWNVFNNFCQIFHKLGDRGFSFTAVCQPLLKGIATFLSLSEIRNRILQNSHYLVTLISRTNQFVISLQERDGENSKNSFRNQGSLYNAGLSLYTSVHILVESKHKMSPDWVGTSCAVIPCFWESKVGVVRATGFQICEILCRSVHGAVALMTVLDSSSTIWTTCYSSLMDPEEPAIVKQYAANTIYNLLVLWNDIELTEVGQSLQLPSWNIMEDFTKLLSHVYWQQTLEETFGNNDSADTIMENDVQSSTNIQLVSPKTVTVLCKIITRMKSVKLCPLHLVPFHASGLCAIIVRLVGLHSVSSALKKNWWIDCCTALSSIVETLITLCHFSQEVCQIILSDKESMVSLIHLLTLDLPVTSGNSCQETEEILVTLWINIASLLALVCSRSGENFEDFEQCISRQRSIIFGRLEDWLNPQGLTKCRKVALLFCNQFICKLTSAKSIKCSVNDNENGHPIFCREWKENKTYGSVLSECLSSVYQGSNDTEEKQLSLQTLTALCSISPSAKISLIEDRFVGELIKKIQEFGQVYHATAESLRFGKKSNIHWIDETISILHLLSALTYKNMKAKQSALSQEFSNTLHKVFKWWIIHIDRSFLQAFLEVLLNYTEEFPQGCQTLVLTSSIIGVGQKKAPSPQSLLLEILELLQQDINSVDLGSVTCVELTFEVMKNASFVPECGNILPKSSLLNFFTQFRVREMRKWSHKQHRVKMVYLKFFLHVSVFPDMQIAIAKIPEASENLLAMIDDGDIDAATLALQILRNLCFQPANKTRFLCDDIVVHCLSNKIGQSVNALEILTAAVALWALIANSEKGKLVAKKCNCKSNLLKATVKLKKLEAEEHSKGKQGVSNAIETLIMLVTLLS